MGVKHRCDLKHIFFIQIQTLNQSFYDSEIIVGLSVGFFFFFLVFSHLIQNIYIQHCIITNILSPLSCSQEKKVCRIAYSHHLFQVRRVISYWKPFVANDYVIYFPGHCRDTDKWGTPEGKVILNTSSSLTLAIFVEHNPSKAPAS